MSLTPKFSKAIDSIPSSGIRKFFDLVEQTDNIISLGVGEPDFQTPWPIRTNAIMTIEKGLTAYTSNQGLKELRQTLSQYIETHYKVHYLPSEFLITNGASEAIDIALRAILNPKDEVILPEPTFVSYKPLITLAGGKPILLDTTKNNFIPDPKEIESKITTKTKAIMLCSPNNPTGVIIPKSILKEISKLAIKYNLWVLSDEIYSELIYNTTFTSISTLPNMKCRTIVINGFSKSYAMTGWRIGYLAAPEELINRAHKIHQYSAMCASTISQNAAITALKTGKPYINKMKTTYNKHRQLCLNTFKKIGFKLPKTNGAFYCFPDISITHLNDEEFAIQLLQEEKVAVIPGSAFGNTAKQFIRCCYATHISDLSEALTRIQRFTKKRIKGEKK